MALTPEQARLIDIAIATKVMGWKRLSYEESAPDNKYAIGRKDLTSYWHDKDLKECALVEDTHDYYDPKSAWSPSTNIADAFEAISKTTVMVHCYLHQVHDGWIIEDQGGELVCKGETVPHVICLAALKSVEGK